MVPCFVVTVLCVLSSFAIILLGIVHQLDVLLLLSSRCIWLLWFFASFSWCRRLSCSVWLWHFLKYLLTFWCHRLSGANQVHYYEARHDKTNKQMYAKRRLRSACVLRVFFHHATILITPSWWPGWSDSSLCVHWLTLLVSSCHGSIWAATCDFQLCGILT